MPEGRRAVLERSARLAEEREKLEQEAKLVTARVFLEHTGSHRRHTSPGREDHAPAEPPQQSTECVACFFALGSGAVKFGCGHTFCNRPSCVSSEVQNCPDCECAVTSRIKLFGPDAGLDLAVVFVESDQRWKKSTGSKRTNPQPQQHQHRHAPSATQDFEPAEEAQTEETEMARVELDQAEVVLIPSGHESLDLSFEVGQDNDLAANNKDDDDRQNARKLHAAKKNVDTFEIEPASIDEEEHIDQRQNARKLHAAKKNMDTFEIEPASIDEEEHIDQIRLETQGTTHTVETKTTMGGGTGEKVGVPASADDFCRSIASESIEKDLVCIEKPHEVAQEAEAEFEAMTATHPESPLQTGEQEVQEVSQQDAVEPAPSAQPLAAQSKRRSFFGAWGKGKQDDAAVQKKDASVKKQSSIFGSIFGGSKQEEVKDVDVPAAAKRDLILVAEAQKKLAGDHRAEELFKGNSMIKQIQETIARLQRHADEFKDVEYGDFARSSLQDGLTAAAEVLENARKSLRKSAEEALALSKDHENEGDLEDAMAQVQLATDIYGELEDSTGASACETQVMILQARTLVQAYIAAGEAKCQEHLFRAATSDFTAALDVLQSESISMQAIKGLHAHVEEVREKIEECQMKLEEQCKLGPRYWTKAQRLHAGSTSEAQSKACLLYREAAAAFYNAGEDRAESEAKRLESMTANNVRELALQEAAHLEVMDDLDGSIERYDWLISWLEYCACSHEVVEVRSLQRGVYRKRATVRIDALKQLCDAGLRQFKRGYRKGEHLLEQIQQDLAASQDGRDLTCEETTELGALSLRLKMLQKFSETWRQAEEIDPAQFYDERLLSLSKAKKELLASAGVAGQRLLWDISNFLQTLADQRKYQPSLVAAGTGADKVFENALLELRQLRAHMQLTFDECQSDAGRTRVEGMASACRAKLVQAIETYQDCQVEDKKLRTEGILKDVDFELQRWVIRQDDLRQQLKEVTDGRHERVLRKLEQDRREQVAVRRSLAQEDLPAITEEDIQREVQRMNGQRKMNYGLHEEGKLDFNRAQVLYKEALATLEGVDAKEAARAASMLHGLSEREYEMQEMIFSANAAARGLWDERADMLCRQARTRTELVGGPSRNQFDPSIAPKPPAVIRESLMGSYGARLVFRPAFDPEPMDTTQRAGGTTHAVNTRPLNERVWLHTKSLYNRTPGQLALSKFTQSLAPDFSTTKANYYSLPKANLSSGLVNAPESEKADHRVLPSGPANLPRAPQLDPRKF
jgi:hypothetical protein